MGLRFRKSIKIAKGVNLNLNKKSVGLSIGGKGARYTINSSGRRTATVGIPGTGLSYSHTSKSGSKKSAAGSGSYVAEKNPMKTGLVPMILTILFGWMGIQWFISGRIGMGCLYLFTLGLFGFGWIVDIVRQVVAFTKGANKNTVEVRTNSAGENIDKLDSEGKLPFGWVIYNKDYIDMIENDMKPFRQAILDAKTDIEKYAALKSFVLYLQDGQRHYYEIGECVGKYFEEYICKSEEASQRVKAFKELEEKIRV